MFAPLPTVQAFKIAKTTQDLEKILETFVLKNYPKSTTSNIGFTKSECFGVLRSFFEFGKIHISVSRDDVEFAVRKFMDQHLWVGESDFNLAPVAPQVDPQYWMPEFHYIKGTFNLFKYYVQSLINVVMTTNTYFKLLFYKTTSLFKKKTNYAYPASNDAAPDRLPKSRRLDS